MLVVHENRGLNPHIEDIARRVALENFVAFAPDALFPLGGYPGDEDKARELVPATRPGQDPRGLHRGRCAPEVAARRQRQGWASSASAMAAASRTSSPRTCPDLTRRCRSTAARRRRTWRTIKAPLLLQFAETDERINAAWPAYEAALKAAGVKYQAFIYPGTQHGFNNDTTPRYNEAAAKLAWQRTVEFFNQQDCRS